jgi:hypothetical protein
VSREIMDTLLEGLDADYIIKIPYKNDHRVIVREAKIYSEQEFFELAKEKNKNFDSDNNITKGIIRNKDLRVEIGKNFKNKKINKILKLIRKLIIF